MPYYGENNDNTVAPARPPAATAFSGFGWASGGGDGERLDLTAHWVGFTALAIFVVAYALVMAEEFTHLRKSKPVILAAGVIWAMIAIVYAGHGMTHAAEVAVRHNLLEYAELMLFLLVAMTYINAMDERNVFEALRSWLVKKGYGFRKLFWITGVLAFFISPIADNLTTALLMCAVVLAVGGDNSKFVLLACINIVVAANAGGAFSPFGDITTLMVWQKGVETAQGPWISAPSSRCSSPRWSTGWCRQHHGDGGTERAPGGRRRGGHDETRCQAHHRPVPADHRHRGQLPQLHAPAAGDRHAHRLWPTCSSSAIT